MSAWIEKMIDFLPPRPQRPVAPASQKSKGSEIVEYHPLKCRKCKSRRVHCYGADRPILYYKCLDCEHKFKVVEKDD